MSTARPVLRTVAPLAPVDATHVLLVIAAYALVFAVIAITRTVRADVLEYLLRQQSSSFGLYP